MRVVEFSPLITLKDMDRSNSREYKECCIVQSNQRHSFFSMETTGEGINAILFCFFYLCQLESRDTHGPITVSDMKLALLKGMHFSGH